MNYTISPLLYLLASLTCTYLESREITFCNTTPYEITLNLYKKNNKKKRYIIPVHTMQSKARTISYKPKKIIRMTCSYKNDEGLRTITDTTFLNNYSYYIFTDCDNHIKVGGTNAQEASYQPVCKTTHYTPDTHNVHFHSTVEVQ